MTQTEFVTQVYEVVGNYNPEVDEFFYRISRINKSIKQNEGLRIKDGTY